VAISLASLKKTSAKPHPLVLLYGPEGVGKDTLFAEFPSPVLIQTPGENPPTGVSIDSFGTVEDFDTLMECFAALFTEEHAFGTLGISAVDGIERIVHAETCKRNSWASIEEPGYGKGYIEADSVWEEFLAPLRELNKPVAEGGKGMAVVLIGHTEIQKFDDPAVGSFNRYFPNLHKRASELIREGADIIAFLTHRVSIVKEKGAFGKDEKKAEGSGSRIIYLEERPGFVAKNRYDMPESINYQRGKGYKELSKYLPEVAK
jgi:hypothetical protein